MATDSQSHTAAPLTLAQAKAAALRLPAPTLDGGSIPGARFVGTDDPDPTPEELKAHLGAFVTAMTGSPPHDGALVVHIDRDGSMVVPKGDALACGCEARP
jgi:hypothetical protein